MRPSLAVPLLAFSLASTGCPQSMLVNGQIEGTRKASAAFDTIGDYELARSAVESGLAQLEGMHVLAPDNADALFMLIKGWVGYGFGFVEDQLEAAQDAGDEDLAEYHRKRARMAYDRAVFYGLQRIGQRADGFEAAKKNQPGLAKWLKDNFASAEDAGELFWTGFGWLARVDLMKGDDSEGAAFVAELYVGVTMLERAVELDPSAEHYRGLVALAAYHARSGTAELDEAKQLFERALVLTQGKNLMVQLTFATKYACAKGDAALYQGLLEKVLQAPDPDPMQRLTNAIAKRRARRWLGKRRVKEACGIDLTSPK